MNGGSLSIWTVYNNPSDMPGQYVARRFEVKNDGPQVTDDTIASKDLDLVRRSLQSRGLICLPRGADDQAHIVECWL